MAAVLASFLSGGWQTTENRAQREVKEADSKMASKHHIMVPVHETVEVGPSTGNTSEQEEEASEHDQSVTQEDAVDGEQDEEYSESAQEEQDKSGAFLRRAPKRKRQNNAAFQKNARLKASTSESEVSAESANSSSEEEASWEAESDSAAENDQAITDGTNCIFCGHDENDDPGEDFEEPVACKVCGERAHRQCAREANLSPSEDDEEFWRCPSCIENGFQSAKDSPNGQLRSSSAPKITRDLLPAQRGIPKPGSHSMFSTLILSDDPMDGSRSLRKRKASTESGERVPVEIRKRPRRATSEVDKPKPQAGLDGQQDIPSPVVGDSHEMSTPRTRGSRRAAQRSERPLVSILEPRNDDSLTLTIRLPPEKLGSLDHEKRKKRKREYERLRRERMQRPAVPEIEVNHFPGLPPQTLREQYLFQENNNDDKNKAKPYGGILTDAEADTSKTFPQPSDMRKFEDARQKAEEEWKKKLQSAAALDLTRPTQKSATSASKIKCINFGGYEIDTWHAAPYPEEYTRNRILYICEFCLKYMNSDFVAWRHKLKCPAKHPPGDEIYRDGSFSFFEVDGRKNPVYCQNLCLLAKLFLGSKTLYYDVEPFLFYIMTENDDFGCHFVGYFSKEKRPSSQNNVSCILVLPIHQRRGFGNLLIDFSYLLTRTEGKTGSPEKPLSDMGLVTYRSYWRLIMCYQLVNQKGTLSINDLSEQTGMTADDVICALEGLRALVRDPVTKTYALRLDYSFMKEYIAKYEAKGYAKLNESALLWVPYVMGRDNQHYETAAPLHTVAQRDDADADDAEPEEGIQQAAAARASVDATTNSDSTGNGANTPDEQDSTITPFPSLQVQDTNTAQASLKVTPTTPFLQLDGSDEQTSTIPATRFEIFPPVPGTGLKKKAGRPPKARPSALRNMSTRHGIPFDDTPSSIISSGRPGSLRRGRSKLGEVVNGDDFETAAASTTDMHDAEEPQSPSHGRGVAGTLEELAEKGQDEDAQTPEEEEEEEAVAEGA